MILAVAAIFAIASISAFDVQGAVDKKDRTVLAVKLSSLKKRKADIERQIAEADKLRNRKIEGVSAESLEEINDRQDSICLELRSQLVQVDLEISECAPDSVSSQVASKYNELLRQQK